MPEALTAAQLQRLRPIAGAAASVLRAIADRPGLARRSDVELAGAGATTAANAALLRSVLLELGLARSTRGGRLELATSAGRLRSLADRLRGLADAAELDAGPPRVEAIVTLPPTSRLASTLSGQLDAHSTRDGFTHAALQARERLVLLVPFGDSEGATLLLRMLATTPAPRRLVFVRPDSMGRRWYDPFRSRIEGTGARLVEYWLPAPSARPETFHAKIALADELLAYVGSSNFMSASLSGGLECGVILRGEHVRPWVVLVDALIRLCGVS
ncbi:MAG: hypothetical protein ACRDQZ_14795 [Mycobacteriales bacterium]